VDWLSDMLPKLLGEFGHARGCSGSQNTVVLVEYGGYMVAIWWNMVEYGGIVWQDQYVICDRLSQLLLFGDHFGKAISWFSRGSELKLGKSGLNGCWSFHVFHIPSHFGIMITVTKKIVPTEPT